MSDHTYRVTEIVGTSSDGIETAIRNALGHLQGLSPREMVYAAPAVLSSEFGFSRTMIGMSRSARIKAPHTFKNLFFP